MDTSVNAANQVVSGGADIAFDADPDRKSVVEGMSGQVTLAVDGGERLEGLGIAHPDGAPLQDEVEPGDPAGDRAPLVCREVACLAVAGTAVEPEGPVEPHGADARGVRPAVRAGGAE